MRWLLEWLLVEWLRARWLPVGWLRAGWLPGGWLLVLAALCGAGRAQAACAVTERTVVPMERSGDLMIVPLMLDGQPARFLLDTGAERSIVTTEAAIRLNLARDEWVATTMQAANGARERNRNANPRRISLGGVALHRRSVARDSSLAVTTPTALPGAGVDGLLGRDFLASFDLSLDLTGDTLRLYDVKGCGGRFLPWVQPYVSVPVSMPAGSAMLVRAEIDGVPLRALVDTGASRGLIAAPGLYRLGLTLTAEDQRAQVGMSAAARPLDARVRRFATLRVGSETLRDPSLLLASVQLFPVADMILGADWLGRRSVWFSFATGQLFITPRD